MSRSITKKWRSRAKPKAPEERNRDIFPSGFDQSKSTSIGPHNISNPDQLYHSLLDHYVPERHVEHIFVTKAWYAKQKKLARHEFILIEVEDQVTRGLINYIVLDRTNTTPAPVCPGVSAFSQMDAKAFDAFRVAYDGNQQKLFQDFRLNNHWLLEELCFPPDEPLPLYELVTLARYVSLKYPNYHPIFWNCYLFAGLIWECIRKLKPSAEYYCEPGFEKDRGTFGHIRYQPAPADVQKIHEAVKKDIAEARGKLTARMNDQVRDPVKTGDATESAPEK